MKPARAFLSLLLLLPTALVAQQRSPTADPQLEIRMLPSLVEFHVSGPEGVFVGGVVLALQPDVTHYFQGLPPLLTDFVVVGVGTASGSYVAGVAARGLPAGIMIYAQGIVVDLQEQAPQVQATQVGSFVLDGESPK